ncbi:MFS transporter [Nocardia sp. NPDC051832]|uniref:MFS transporter n=1 Tax=Nocardia sp. NPDC051832 TaxID=3155673 RepID=UPI00344352F7
MGHRYYLLLTGYLVSALGNWIYRLTLPLLVLHLTGSALHTAAVYAIEYAPFLLLSLPGGVFADRFDRRRLLVTGDLAAGVIAAVLAVIVITGSHALWPLYLAAFLLACVEPIYHPAFHSWLPELVDEDDFAKANSWMHSVDNLTILAGPAAAGALIGLLGYNAAIVIDAATFLFSACAIALIRRSPATPRKPVEKSTAAPSSSMRAEIGEAARHVFKENPVLLAGSLLFTGTNLAIWIVQANFVYYLTAYRGFSPAVIGAVLATQGVGALIGTAIAPRLLARFAPGRLILAATVGAGLATLALIPLRSPLLIGIAGACAFAFGSVNVVSWFTFRQRIVPQRLLGRVIAVTRMLAFASIPVAALLSGALEDALRNMYIVLAVGGLLRIAVAVAGLRTPLARAEKRCAPTPSMSR